MSYSHKSVTRLQVVPVYPPQTYPLSAIVIDGKGYLVTGEYGSLLSNYWIYDPATDLWEGEDLTAFEGSVRKNAVAFSTGTRGFVVTGQASSSYYDDTWELSPYEYEEE